MGMWNYLDILRDLMHLVVRSWGFEFQQMQPVAEPHPMQKWCSPTGRLYRIAKCMLLFGQPFEFGFVRRFALKLVEAKGDEQYRGRSLFELFEMDPFRIV